MRERNVGRRENPIRARKALCASPSLGGAPRWRNMRHVAENYPAQFRWRHRAGHNLVCASEPAFAQSPGERRGRISRRPSSGIFSKAFWSFNP